MDDFFFPDGDQGLEDRSESTLTIELSMLQQKSREAMARAMEETQASVALDQSISGSEIDELKERILSAVQAIESGLVERETEVRLLLLAALSGEHILFIGPPGTAKSELGRRLSTICQGQFFERLLTRFSVPEELFGPLSMRALENDEYVRQTDGYLPQATVAFIDEIFKANSAILNTLLTILNERLFDNGAVRVRVPLLCLVGASNELPESEELDALYDRFLVRKEVKQVSSGGLADLLASAGQTLAGSHNLKTQADPGSILNEDDFRLAQSEARKHVKVPDDVVDLLIDLRIWLQEKCEPPVYLSDRRLVKAMVLLQVAAYTDGRNLVTQYDCILLQHIFWNQPDESERIYEWLLGRIVFDDNIAQVQFLISGIFGRACKYIKAPEKKADLLVQIQQIKSLLLVKMKTVLQCVDGGFPQLTNNIWLSRDERESAVNALLPRLQKSRSALEETLFELVALETALQENVDAVLLATLMPKRWSEFIREGPKEIVDDLGTIRRGSGSF